MFFFFHFVNQNRRTNELNGRISWKKYDKYKYLCNMNIHLQFCCHSFVYSPTICDEWTKWNVCCVCVDLSDGWPVGRLGWSICIYYYKLYLYVCVCGIEWAREQSAQFLFFVSFFFFVALIAIRFSLVLWMKPFQTATTTETSMKKKKKKNIKKINK